MAETQPDPAVWRTQHLRLTAFPETEEPLLLVRDWWQAIVGGPPLREITNPQGGTVELVGVYRDAPLGMEAQRGRVDIQRPYAVGEQPPDTLPLFGEALTAFADLATRWLKHDTSPSVHRLALGVNALRLVPGVEDCRSTLDAYLPTVDMQRTAPVGFLYQVNRRCTSQAESDLAVNRIAKWTVHQFRMPPSGSPYGIELELDMNSAPGHAGRLDQAVTLFDEFAHHAERFALEGDQP